MDASRKTILVTGGVAFIGTRTVVQLLNEGFKVLIIDNLDNFVIEAVDRVKELVGPELSKKLQFNLFHLGLCLQMTYNECNLTSVELDFTCNNWLRFDAIIHFASLKIELQYLHEYAGISSSIGLTTNPIVNFSSVLGTNVLALGIDISFDKKTENFTKCNMGLSFTNADLIAFLALHVNEKGDLVNTSYYHILNPSTNTIIATEVTHSFFTNVNTIIVGIQHALDLLTTIKA
ncbi:hypothetical protein J1N35_022458 [Gossypium stocksii]|uniref:NAD(P)-binding domain-containing protein n=1 Tax=Gossypium stocksii TaxID=47602 RepID=A0A9D3VHN0_9ROSI|nr:hypothetical protein J1N35_022458 [Gossypium stocksii]